MNKKSCRKVLGLSGMQDDVYAWQTLKCLQIMFTKSQINRQLDLFSPSFGIGKQKEVKAPNIQSKAVAVTVSEGQELCGSNALARYHLL